MRLELLGLSMTPQHSDSRVLDQLIYKWSHSRGIIGKVLAEKYDDLAATGWEPTRAEIERDVRDLFGGAPAFGWRYVRGAAAPGRSDGTASQTSRQPGKFQVLGKPAHCAGLTGCTAQSRPSRKMHSWLCEPSAAGPLSRSARPSRAGRRRV